MFPAFLTAVYPLFGSIPNGVWVLLAILAAYLVVPPLLTLAALKLSTKPKLEPFSDKFSIPEDSKEYFRDAGNELRSLGFKYNSTWVAPNFMGNQTPIFQFFVHPQQFDCAMVTIFFLDQGSLTEHTQYVEFDSKFENGMEICTGNPRELSGFKSPDDVVKTHLPWIDDLAELYQAHQKIIRNHVRNSPKLNTLAGKHRGNAREFITTDLIKELDEATRQGTMRKTSDNKYYRASFFGAFTITWGQMFPFSAIRRSRQDAAARKRIEG